MESLISTFHIDTGLFIAQLVNFAIVFFVLYFLVFKPLIKNMSERSARIDKSLQDADEIERRFAAVTQEREDIIAEAKRKAHEIMMEADSRGEERRLGLVAKAKEEIAQVINLEREKLVQEKAATLQDIKKEVVDLVIITVKKFLGEKMDITKEAELIKKMIK